MPSTMALTSASPRCLTGISDPDRYLFRIRSAKRPFGQEMSASAAKIEHETEHPPARERNPSAGPRAVPEEVSQVSQAVTVPPPASTAQALGMLQSAMGYLAAADATAMAAETQARCLRALEQATRWGPRRGPRSWPRSPPARGTPRDADYSPRAWLIHQTHVTKGAAVGYTAWVRRAAAHPEIAAALAAGDDLGVGRPDDLRLDRQAARGLPGGRGCDPAGGGGGRRGCGGPGRAGRGDLRPVPAPKTRTRTRTRRSRTGR